jgi:hypothetical protein
MQIMEYLGHFHTGGNPGRHELDDTQELNWRTIAGAIADLNYTELHWLLRPRVRAGAGSAEVVGRGGAALGSVAIHYPTETPRTSRQQYQSIQ